MAKLGEGIQTVIYHALGADLKQGLAEFEKYFAEGESNFQIGQLESLLAVIGDDTLHNIDRTAWYNYYAARLAFLKRKPALVDQYLKKALPGEDQELMPVQPGFYNLLEVRKTLLDGKNRILQGDWFNGITLLDTAGKKAAEIEETTIQWEAERARMEGFLEWARADGDWQEPANNPFIRGLQHLLLVFLIPLFFVVWVFLKARGITIFSQPVWHYGMYYSNWPIFWYYQQAYLSSDQCLKFPINPSSPNNFRFQMRRADLLCRLLAYNRANDIYKEELDRLPQDGDEISRYRKAQILQGQAISKIQGGDHAEAKPLLSEARATFASVKDRASWAWVVLQLGYSALKTGRPRIALRDYSIAARIMQQSRDLAGLSEVLERLNEFGQVGGPDAQTDNYWQTLDSIQPKSFAVRLPAKLFDLLQLASWALPVIVTMGVTSFVSYQIIRAPVTGMNSLWLSIVSWKLLPVVLLLLLGIGFIQALLGAIGLVSALRSRQMSLDYVIIGQDGIIYRSPVADRSAQMRWAEITSHVRVERGFWGKPGGAVSFEFLQSIKKQYIRLPGTVSYYQHLQQAVQQRTGIKPHVERMNMMGIEIITLILVSMLEFLVAFTLAQRPLPQLDVPIRAWLAAVSTFVYYIIILAVTIRWVTHFARVYYVTAKISIRRLQWAMTGVSVLMIGIGLVLKPAFLMWSPMFVGWGVMLLITVLFHTEVFSNKYSLPVRWGLRAGIYLLGGLLVLRTILPIAVNLYAFTYLGAASGYNSPVPNPPEEPLRSAYFKEMKAAGLLMNRIDATHPFAYGYLGYAEYWNGNYTSSLSYYEQGIQSFKPFQAPPDFYYCRALAYWKMGEEESANQECNSFKASGAYDTNCERLFPDEINVCEKLP